MAETANQITVLLRAVARGDDDAKSKLLPVVMAELRRIARSRLSRLKPGETVLATDLAHDAYLRLMDSNSPWKHRRHFYAAASRIIRDMLVDETRRRRRGKRGGDWKRVALTEAIPDRRKAGFDYIALDEALHSLERANATGHEVVMLRYFCGLTIDDVAKALDVSRSTVDRQWRFARAWLIDKLV